VVANFGRPTEPIEIRHTQSPPSGADNPAVATATQLKGNPMHIDQLYPSKFLRAADLNGKPLRVTIAGLKREDIGGEQKVILSFTDSKSLILNKTNARAIAKALGDETRGWAGKDIVLVPASVDFRGDMVDAIRVRAATPRPQQQKAPNSDEPPFDDDLSDFAA
jgi:hypothetical protein